MASTKILAYRTVGSSPVFLATPPHHRNAIAKQVDPRTIAPLAFGVSLTFLLVGYSMLGAYTDGRFMWPVCVFTIPIALWVIRDGWSIRIPGSTPG
jgi:hypothetical protein